MAITKNFPKFLGCLIVLLSVPIVSWAACTGSSPTWSATADFASVQSCVSQAVNGDTVNVAAGTETWTQNLCIHDDSSQCGGDIAGEKVISLIGAGIGQTVITHGASLHTPLIWVETPSDLCASNPNDYVMRISGFSMDMQDSSSKRGVLIKTESQPCVVMHRVDHNHFYDSQSDLGGAVGTSGKTPFGVIDNNRATGMRYPFRVGTSNGASTWAAYGTYTPGTDQNLYIEDNVISFSPITLNNPIIDGDYGGRWLLRYNTITVAGGHSSLTDAHGDSSGGVRGTMGVEMYGNYIDSGGLGGIKMIKAGGVRIMVFHNYVDNNTEGNVIGIGLDTLGAGIPDITHSMNRSYFFQNFVENITTQNPTLLNSRKDYTGQNHDNQMREDETFWMDDVNCVLGSDTSGCEPINNGVGCGSSLPTTCTPSVDTSFGSTGFWLTDQSCTDTSSFAGASTDVAGGTRNPASVIEGTLYTCTATDTWTAWYTPFTYPHPLRAGGGGGGGGGNTVLPKAPSNPAVIQQ